MDRLQAIQDQLLERHRAMSTTARAILWSWAVLQLVVIAAFIIVTPSRIFESEHAKGDNRSEKGYYLRTDAFFR